jgi:outer membrane protein assembly factor BamA
VLAPQHLYPGEKSALFPGMKTLPILLLGAAAALVQAAGPQNPEKMLYDSAIRAEQEGKIDVARMVFQVIAANYKGDELADSAKNELCAIDLYREGQERLQAGNARAAFVAFRTLMQVYPESLLAQRAEAASRTAQSQTPESAAPVVRAIEFQGTTSAEVAQIIRRLAEREARLAVEQPYDSRDVDQAKALLAELLDERGIAYSQINTTVEALPPHSVKVLFRVVKQ